MYAEGTKKKRGFRVRTMVDKLFFLQNIMRNILTLVDGKKFVFNWTMLGGDNELQIKLTPKIYGHVFSFVEKI